MRIEPFGVEQWMNACETRCGCNLGRDLRRVADRRPIARADRCRPGRPARAAPLKLTYGAIEGSDRLRAAIAAFYDRADGARAGRARRDRRQRADLPDARRARRPRGVAGPQLPAAHGHPGEPRRRGAGGAAARGRRLLPDLEAVRRAPAAGRGCWRSANPEQPDRGARRHVGSRGPASPRRLGAYVLCDEVYRGHHQSGDGLTASIVDLTPRGIAGQHVQGVLARRAAPRVDRTGRPRCCGQRYRSIATTRRSASGCSTIISPHRRWSTATRSSAATARWCATNLAVLDAWVGQSRAFVRQADGSGTTALVKIDSRLPSRDFCERLLTGPA